MLSFAGTLRRPAKAATVSCWPARLGGCATYFQRDREIYRSSSGWRDIWGSSACVTSPSPRRGAPCWRLRPNRPNYFAPQHAFMPNVVSLLSTPDLGLSVMSVTPVSI